MIWIGGVEFKTGGHLELSGSKGKRYPSYFPMETAPRCVGIFDMFMGFQWDVERLTRGRDRWKT